MTEPYGLPAGTAINYKALGFPEWVDELCRQWGLDSSTYPGHQEGDRPDIGSAPNPEGLNRGIDWSGPADKMLAFAHWLVSIAPERQPGQYGPPGLEMVIYRHVPTGEDVTYPQWVDFSGDLPEHTDHVHTRFSASIVDVAPPSTPQVMTVPLVQQPDGTWTSTSPAWAHLIMRESGGNPTIIQQIVDSNSGGNEAEGLFQITPATWGAHGGYMFAPTARLATPQQQAIVAANIFTANPSGSDWGAGLPGREDAGELAAGLVPLTETPPSPQPEEDWMADPELARMIRELHAAWLTPDVSKSRYADDRKWTLAEKVNNMDGVSFDSKVEHDAAYDDPWSMTALRNRAATDPIAAAVYQNLIAPTPAPTPTSSPTQPPTAAPQPPPQTPITPPPEPHPQPSGQPASVLEALAQFKVNFDRLMGY